MESSELQLIARGCGVSRQLSPAPAAVLALPRQVQSQTVVDSLAPLAIGHGVAGHKVVNSLAVKAVSLFGRQRRMCKPFIGLFVVVVLFDFVEIVVNHGDVLLIGFG